MNLEYYGEIFTPVAPLTWPKIFTPDEKFNKYKADLLFPTRDAAKPFIDKYKGFYIQALGDAKAKKLKWPWEIDEDEGTVRVIIRSDRQPAIYDARGTAVSRVLNVGSGSLAKVKALVASHEGFALLKIKSVQLLKVEAGNQTQDAEGFEDVSATYDFVMDAPVDDEPSSPKPSDDLDDSVDF